MFDAVRPTAAERAAPMPGDDAVDPADVVMDRAFDLPAAPEVAWPWIVQLGKGRGRWYLPRSVERFLPRGGRGLRHIDARWQHLTVGDVVPDYGRDATFTVAEVRPPQVLVYSSQRGAIRLTWAITLTRSGSSTRVRLRLRLGGVRRVRLADTAGGLLDLVTIAGMAAGLRERLQGSSTT